VKVGTLFGEHPFEFQRVERRRGSLVVVGTVAGIKSNLILERRDIDLAARALSAASLLLALGWARRGRR
jgi:hypothetical protein